MKKQYIAHFQEEMIGYYFPFSIDIEATDLEDAVYC